MVRSDTSSSYGMSSNEVSADDPHLLVAKLHRNALVRLSSILNCKLQGLAVAGRMLSASSRWKRRLRELDSTLGMVEKISCQSCSSWLQELEEELQRLGYAAPIPPPPSPSFVGCYSHGSYSESDEASIGSQFPPCGFCGEILCNGDCSTTCQRYDISYCDYQTDSTAHDQGALLNCQFPPCRLCGEILCNGKCSACQVFDLASNSDNDQFIIEPQACFLATESYHFVPDLDADNLYSEVVSQSNSMPVYDYQTDSERCFSQQMQRLSLQVLQ